MKGSSEVKKTSSVSHIDNGSVVHGWKRFGGVLTCVRRLLVENEGPGHKERGDDRQAGTR